MAAYVPAASSNYIIHTYQAAFHFNYVTAFFSLNVHGLSTQTDNFNFTGTDHWM